MMLLLLRYIQHFGISELGLHGHVGWWLPGLGLHWYKAMTTSDRPTLLGCGDNSLQVLGKGYRVPVFSSKDNQLDDRYEYRLHNL